MATEFTNNRGHHSGSSNFAACRNYSSDPRGQLLFPFERQGLTLVRPYQVVRARALLADPDYPSDAVLERVARLLSMHLGA